MAQKNFTSVIKINAWKLGEPKQKNKKNKRNETLVQSYTTIIIEKNIIQICIPSR